MMKSLASSGSDNDTTPGSEISACSSPQRTDSIRNTRLPVRSLSFTRGSGCSV